MLIRNLENSQNWNQWFQFLLKNPEGLNHNFLKQPGRIHSDLLPVSLPVAEMSDLFLGAKMKVLNFGSLDTALYFEKKGCKVTSIYSITEYTRSKIDGNDNLIISFHDLIKDGCLKLTSTLNNNTYDFIYIDCVENENFNIRPLLFKWAESHINYAGLIIINHSWRYGFLQKDNKAKYSLSLAGPGANGKYFSQTDIYFY